jgi:hypothetical protein
MAISEHESKIDLEKSLSKNRDITTTDLEIHQAKPYGGTGNVIGRWLAKSGVEVRGISPVPVEERTKTNYISTLFMWISILCNLLP